MTMRHRQRHVQQTIVDYVDSSLTHLNWIGATPPFGTSQVTLIESDPEEMPAEFKVNTVAVSLGDEDEDTVEELGGGFYSVAMPVFFDVFGERHAISVAIASDIKDMFNRGKQLKVSDWTTGVGVPTTDYMEFESVVGPLRPEASFGTNDRVRKHWRVVKAMAVVYYTP